MEKVHYSAALVQGKLRMRKPTILPCVYRRYHSAFSHCWRQETVCCLQTDNLTVRSGPVRSGLLVLAVDLLQHKKRKLSVGNVSPCYHMLDTCKVCHCACGTICGTTSFNVALGHMCGTVWHYMWHCISLNVELYGNICGTVWHYV